MANQKIIYGGSGGAIAVFFLSSVEIAKNG